MEGRVVELDRPNMTPLTSGFNVEIPDPSLTETL